MYSKKNLLSTNGPSKLECKFGHWGQRIISNGKEKKNIFVIVIYNCN
jgi:hypothetical protein